MEHLLSCYPYRSCYALCAGHLGTQSFTVSNTTSVIAAPIPTCLFYALAAVVCGQTGVVLNGTILFLWAAIGGFVLLAISIVLWKSREKQSAKFFFASSKKTERLVRYRRGSIRSSISRLSSFA